MQVSIESKVLVGFEEAFLVYYQYSIRGMMNEVSPLRLLGESASELFLERMIDAIQAPAK